MAETIAIIGTQLIALLGMLYYLGQRIDGVNGSLGQRIDERSRELREEMRAMATDIRNEIHASRAELSARLDAHIERHTA